MMTLGKLGSPLGVLRLITKTNLKWTHTERQEHSY